MNNAVIPVPKDAKKLEAFNYGNLCPCNKTGAMVYNWLQTVKLKKRK